jgi:hypothetical protein
MAKKAGLSKPTIGRIWRDFGLKPYPADGFKLSSDPVFMEKVVDVVGLYHDPPGRSHDYCRHGITSLFAALTSPMARSSPSCTASTGRPSSGLRP